MNRLLFVWLGFCVTVFCLPAPVWAASSAVVRASAFPATAAVKSQIPVDIIIDTNGASVQAAQVQFTFSANLTYTSFSGSTSVFTTSFIDPRVSGNTITIARGTLSSTPITGNNQEFIHLIFTLTKTGTTSLTFASTSPNTELVAPDSSNVSYTAPSSTRIISAPIESTPKATSTPREQSTSTPTSTALPAASPTPSPSDSGAPSTLPPVIAPLSPTVTPSIPQPVTPTSGQTDKTVGTSLVILGFAVGLTTILTNTRHH